MNTFLETSKRDALDGVVRVSLPFTQAEVQRGESGVLTVQGTLVTYGGVNANGFLHVPGAAKASLERRQAAGRSIPMGYQHSPFSPLTVIGKWGEWADSKQGISADGRVSDTTAGRDAAVLLEDGAIDGISIGFRPVYSEGEETVQVLAPGQTGVWKTPYGRFEYTASDWTVAFSQIDVCEASIVHQPADEDARVEKLLQATLHQAAKAMPGLQSESWDDVAYSMALLMGGRGAGAFTDLPEVQRLALYQRLAGAYVQHDKTPPPYDAAPDYAQILFQHDERQVFADRYLRKTAATLTATARGIQGPLSQETREVVDQARTALEALGQTTGLADELRQAAGQLEASTHALQGETTP